MCRFIVCIVYIHSYTSFLTEVALTRLYQLRQHLFKADHLESKTSKNDYTVFYFFKSLKICESMAI